MSKITDENRRWRREWLATYEAANSEQRIQMKKTDRLRKYHISEVQYNEILSSQNNLCMICSNPHVKTPAIDHDHETGKVRGLLCGRCNSAIGFLKDDVLVAFNAVAYLLKNLPDKKFNNLVDIKNRIGDSHKNPYTQGLSDILTWESLQREETNETK